MATLASVYRLETGRAGRAADIGRPPFSLKILLENLLRHEDVVSVTAESIEALSRATSGASQVRSHRAQIVLSGQDPPRWTSQARLSWQISRRAMRDAMVRLWAGIWAPHNPAPAELVIDYSVIADVSGR